MPNSGGKLLKKEEHQQDQDDNLVVLLDAKDFEMSVLRVLPDPLQRDYMYCLTARSSCP